MVDAPAVTATQHRDTGKWRRRRHMAESWCAVLAPVAMYIYGNVSAAGDSGTLVVAGVAAPVAFCLALRLDLESRDQEMGRTARIGGTLLTVLVMLCTAIWSWVHMLDLVQAIPGMGIGDGLSLIVLIDALQLVGLYSLAQQRRRRRRELAEIEEGVRLTLPAEIVEAIATEHEIVVEQETDLTVLYQLLSIDDVVIRVGITSSIEARIRAYRNEPWFGEVATMVVRTYPTRAQALAVEEHLISTLWPLHNDQAGSLADAVTRRNERKAGEAPSRPPRVTRPKRQVVNLHPVRRDASDELEAMPRDALRAVARDAGVPVRGSRAQIAERVRAARGGNGTASEDRSVTGDAAEADEPERVLA